MAKARGSDLLKNRYTEKDLSALLESTAIEGVTLVDFFPKGIPNPDGGWGVYWVGHDRILDLLQALLAQPQIPHFKVFPKGVPVVDNFEVVVRGGSARG